MVDRFVRRLRMRMRLDPRIARPRLRTLEEAAADQGMTAREFAMFIGLPNPPAPDRKQLPPWHPDFDWSGTKPKPRRVKKKRRPRPRKVAEHPDEPAESERTWPPVPKQNPIGGPRLLPVGPRPGRPRPAFRSYLDTEDLDWIQAHLRLRAKRSAARARDLMLVGGLALGFKLRDLLAMTRYEAGEHLGKEIPPEDWTAWISWRNCLFPSDRFDLDPGKFPMFCTVTQGRERRPLREQAVRNRLLKLSETLCMPISVRTLQHARV